ncbi:SAFB-like transcription modulator [Bagarius yarrelli]|uniref:SAFB-like transcription modulator n=1 Tax=Bagarius yarrelli TaxID=175774 RepID=A0A556TLJ3_BAGYA|nr:SAFB-like transcription modulator [Bagarius yarrelli]
MHPNYGHGHHIHVPQTMSSHPRQTDQRTTWELGIEAGVTVAPYPSGHLHPHLPHYHPPPRLHHFPIPLMHPGMSEVTYPHIRYISSRMTFGRTYEDLLHLEERLGTVNRGASQGTIERCTYPHKYKKRKLHGKQDEEEGAEEDTEEKCTICLSILEEGEDVRSGKLKWRPGAISAETKKITDLRVVDLKTDLLKRRNLERYRIVKNVLIARLKQALEDEGADPERIEVPVSADTPARKTAKSKGRRNDSDGDITMEEDSFSKANVTDTDDATRENTKSFSDVDGLAEPEAEPDVEAEPEIEAELEPDLEAEAEVEPEVPAVEASESEAAPEPGKEVEEDNISVTIQAEDAITLDVDGDDLLETGKHVKLPDSEADKGCEEPEASAETRQEADSMDEVKDSHKDCKRDDSPKTDATKKDSREALKKAETGDKEKDSGKKGPSSAGAAGNNSSTGSTRNLWVSGLSSNTKAADLKNLFGKYGKVFSAKVVTSARSPGAKCYGLVTMSSSAEVVRCISHLDGTELHGQQISVDRVKSDPFKKDSKKEGEDKTGSNKAPGEKRLSTGLKATSKTQVSSKKEEKKPAEKDSKESAKKQESKNTKSDTPSSSSASEPKKDEKKHGRKSPGKIHMLDQSKGQQGFNKPRLPFRRGGRFDKIEALKKGRPFFNKGGNKDILPFEKMKEQRMRERMIRMERVRRAMELRRRREVAERERRERERLRVMREREERENLMRERQRLEMERQKLERERMERERLERERIRIEQERRKEAERMAREREELRRQQEQLRYEQEKRNNLKRGRDVDHRRDDTYWNGNKKIQPESEGRISQASDYSNRQQGRFSDFSSRDRTRFPDNSAVQSTNFDRRNRYDCEPEAKKNRPDPRREGSGFERYPKSFDSVHRSDPPTPSGRSDLRDTDRRDIRDRDERRPVSMPERSAGGRAPPPTMSHSRSARDTGHTGWKNDSSISTKPSDVRGAVRMRPEHSVRDGPGHNIRGASSANRGRGTFSSRDGGRPAVMGDQQHFSSGRQVVVERHSRDQGPRKEWHSSSSQSGGFADSRRMGESRPAIMNQHSSHSSSGINRIVQITNVPMSGSSGGFKPFKGRF